MATLFVRHDVNDFATWKAAYDAFEGARQSMGVTGHGAYQVDGQPNSVTVYHHFDNMEQAKAFAGSDQLKEAMKKAGVVGAPDIWFARAV